jgi:hypothetical protein
MAYAAKRLLYQEGQYIVPMSATSSLAVELSEGLKLELDSNELIQAVFPTFGTGDWLDRNTREEWVTGAGMKILPRGAGQQIRGRKQKHYRPDLFLPDDLETDEGVESEEQRRKLERWFFSAVVNSVDRGVPNWRIIFIGTVLHEDSLLSNLLRNPEWTTVRLDICNDQYVSNWPEFMSTEEIKSLADSYRSMGLLDVFYREYRNIPIALEEQGFKASYFNYYNDEFTEEAINRNRLYETVITFDPAKTHTKASANTAIVGISVNVTEGRWLIRDIIEQQLYPDEVYDAVFEMAERLGALIIAPEVSGLNEYITWPLKNEMTRRGLHYIMIEVSPREGKASKKRSGALVPLYRNKLITHNKNTCGPLEKYLMQWPRPEKWDVIDAVASMIYVLKEGERYFSPNHSDITDIEEEYKELENDPPMQNWRRM